MVENCSECVLKSFFLTSIMSQTFPFVHNIIAAVVSTNTEEIAMPLIPSQFLSATREKNFSTAYF